MHISLISRHNRRMRVLSISQVQLKSTRCLTFVWPVTTETKTNKIIM